MNQPTRTRPGHWGDVPSTEEIAAADEQQDAARPPGIAVGTAFIAVLLLIAFVVWLARFFLTKG